MKAILRRWELWLCLAAVAVAAGFLAWTAAAGDAGTAVVTVDGEQAYVINLATSPYRVIELAQDWGVSVTLEVKNHQIRYVNVTCPDHICENTGFIHKAGQTAVCMPNRVVVTVV